MMSRLFHVAGVVYAEFQAGELPFSECFFVFQQPWVRIGIGVASVTVGVIWWRRHRLHQPLETFAAAHQPAHLEEHLENTA